MLFSPAHALWSQRAALTAAQSQLVRLQDAVGSPVEMSRYQALQWYACVLDWKPDLIVELGRLYGNSACIFTEAAAALGSCRVVSLCLTDVWQKTIAARVAPLVPREWFEHLDARTADILTVDPVALLSGAQRILVLWDAHGFEVASWMLGALMPAIGTRDHLVLMHDISDQRYCGASSSYDGASLWSGENEGANRMVLGHYNSAVAQLVSALDFTTRNGVNLHTADESLRRDLTPKQAATLNDALGLNVTCQADWAWFSLDEAVGARTYPRFEQPAPPRGKLRRLFRRRD